MDTKNLLDADYLDIIYDRRNKKYGGYELRRHYDQRLKKAVLFAFTGVAALFSFSFITSSNGGAVHRSPNLHPDSISVVVVPVHPPAMPEIIPPAPPPAQHIKANIFTTPVVVDNKDIPPDKQMTENKNLTNAQPGPRDNDGDATGLSPTSSTGTGISEAIINKPSEPVRYVEQMPQFNGDMNAYISNKIRYPESARSNNIEGRVVIEFVVNEDGSVSNARVVRGIGGGCDEEALRIVNSMPKWKPGKQNGTPVKVFFILPVIFKLD